MVQPGSADLDIFGISKGQPLLVPIDDFYSLKKSLTWTFNKLICPNRF